MESFFGIYTYIYIYIDLLIYMYVYIVICIYIYCYIYNCLFMHIRIHAKIYWYMYVLVLYICTDIFMLYICVACLTLKPDMQPASKKNRQLRVQLTRHWGSLSMNDWNTGMACPMIYPRNQGWQWKTHENPQ